MTNAYLTEGSYSQNEINKELISSIYGLEKAMNEGIILESTAIKCDNNLRLTVELGNYVGYINKEDAVLTFDEEPKDIAVITRVGKPVCFKVMSIDKDSYGEPIIKLSRREAQKEYVESYLRWAMPGDILPAKVTHLEQFGAFVDIGCGVISLLSIDSISVSRISHPRDRFYIGADIRCIVRKVEDGGRRIYVTHKELLGTWEENVSMFEIGQTVTGIVRSVEDYGIFVELTPNLAGLAEYKSDVFPGQSAAVFIKNIIPERMKVKLVLIDTYDTSGTVNEKIKYYVPEDETRLEEWTYSPDACEKVVKTVFE